MTKSTEEFTSSISISQTWKQLATTTVTCSIAAFITLPADTLIRRWQTEALSSWKINHESTSYSSTKLRMFSPIFRLFSNEIAATFVPASMESSQALNTSIIKTHIIAGIIAGSSQALVTCPIQAYQAHKIASAEEQQIKNSNMWSKFKSYFLSTSINLQERLYRAYRGVSLFAAREILFNVTFFPLFYQLQYYSFASVSSHLYRKQLSKNDELLQKFKSIAFSGIISGILCYAIVTPLDVLIMYFNNSREHWNIWSGKRLVSPPVNVLFRGVSLQALTFGPVFGIVATIYELT